MNLSRRNDNGYSILSIEGRVDTTNYNEFEHEINEILDSGENKLILNCKGLSYISSSGLRVILATQKKLMSEGDKLFLCEMQPSIKEIFDISGFTSIFKIFETEEEAVGA